MPKKPQSSYFHFMNSKRGEVKEADPSLKFGELTKKLTDMWKNLTPEEKQVYEDLAARDKERYQEEMQAKGLAKAPVDADAPKKPKSSFFLFSDEQRVKIKKANPDIKQTDILK